jgi:predicted cupin superfamily sugar epimerase
MPVTAADAIIALLGLAPHPEGGHFAETFRDGPGADGRARSTAIYYLLRKGERSSWHRVDAVEIWHHYAGAALEISIAEDGLPARRVRLGRDLVAGDRPQAVVPQGAWQSARPLGDWALVGCTVAPGFVFSGFELAPEGFEPPP